MANRNQSASRGAPFTVTVKSRTLPGRPRGGRHAKRVDASFAGFLRRLRRLEFGVLALLGKAPKGFNLDQFVKDVLSLEADAKIESRGSTVRRGAIQVPLEGTGRGQGEGTPSDPERLESGGEDSPFPPSPPTQGEKE